jgi:hypothetical protein
VNDLDLSARLHDLADDLGSPRDEISTDSVIAEYRRRRRTRAGVIATVAAVVAVCVGVPTATGRLSSGEVANPSPSVDSTWTAPTTSSTAAPSRSTAPAPSTPDPAHVAELGQVAAGLPRVSLSSPELWDQWLPEGKPYPGADTADDLSTCPVLSSRLAAVTGQEMSYWTGTLPGPGCTWVETPLSAQNNDYDYLIGVGFLADGTTRDSFRGYREGPGQGIHACPSTDLPAVSEGALLLRCDSSSWTTYTLVVPDTRLDGGLWVLTAQSKNVIAPVRPAAILPVLVDGVVAAFG